MMTPETERNLKKCGTNVARWTEARDAWIRKALSEGGSLRVIGKMVGLSHSAVAIIGEKGGPLPEGKPEPASL